MSDKPRITREQLLGATVLPMEDIDVPELGGTQRVRGLRIVERDRINSIFGERKGNDRLVGLRELVLRLGLVTDQGEQMVGPEDDLSGLRADVGERLYDAITKLSGMVEPQAIQGNSVPSLNGSTSTSSR